MEIELIEGEYRTNEAMELIVQMIEIKIKFHESKICNLEQEEDIKSRENKIKKLQKSLYDIRIFLNTKNSGVRIKSSIHID
jgi:hypothetical protein